MELPLDSPRARLEQALRDAYAPLQFATVVRALLGEPLYNITTADSHTQVVHDFLNWLEQDDQKRLHFLLQVRDNTDARLRGAIEEALGIGSPGGDPYLAPLVYGRPYVDRSTFREGLRNLFKSAQAPCMFVRGPRYSGRTLSAHYIQHVASEVGIRVIHVDLSKDSLEDIVDQIATRVKLTRENLRDRTAQPSAQAKGVAWELISRSQDFLPHEGYCIVVDHYDIPTASPNARTFVDTLASNLVPPSAQRVWLVVLGHEGALPAGTDFFSIKERLTKLQRPDVVRWLQDWSVAAGAPLAGDALEARCDEVLEGLALPLDPEADPTGLDTMATRLHDLMLA